MKRFLPVLVLLVVVLTGGTAVVFAAPERQGEQPDLVPLELTWPEDVNPGDEIDFDLRFTNMGADIEGEVETTFSLTLEPTGDAPEPAVVPFEKSVTISDMETGDTRIVTGTLLAPREGSYTVAATIGPIEGEANEDNNTRSEDLEVTSALPPELVNLFAGLGVFAAVMAIVAVGTEVVVDSVRVLLGLKRKITAMEAFEQLQGQLPGQLAELGVAAPKLEEFKEQVKELRAVLQTPVDIAETATLIRAGKLGEALADRLSTPVVAGLAAAIREQLIDEANWPAGKKALAGKIQAEITAEEIAAVIHSLLENGGGEDILDAILTDQRLQVDGKTLKQHLDADFQAVVGKIVNAFKERAAAVLDGVPASVGNWLADWMAKLKLSNYFRGQVVSAVTSALAALMNALKTALNQVQPHGVVGWLKRVTGDMSEIVRELAQISNRQGPEAAADWLEQQGEALINQGSREVMGRFDNEFRPFLASLGMSAGDTDKARDELDKGLGYLSSQTQASTALYVASLKELLLTVEQRRKAMQSPVRKMWRAVRRSSYPLIVAVLALSIAAAGIIIGSGLLGTERERLGWWVIVIPLVASLVIAFFGDGILSNFVKHGSRWKYSVGQFFSNLEKLWNRILQRPNSYGNVEDEIKAIIEKIDEGIAGTKVAAVLQERADMHRDEEASRLRWLRVVSLIIGIGLAYLLQIDAAELLNTVIPDISNTINVFHVTVRPLAFLPERPPLDAIVLTPGMLITGLAASAGSAFWHDQLDRLQAAKRATEEAASLIRDVKGEK